MATPENKPEAQLEKPAGTPEPKKEQVMIHVIPEQFYGAALKKKVPKKKPEAQAAIPPQQPTTAQVPPGQQPPQSQKKKGKGMLILIILLIVILGGGGATAYFILTSEPVAPVPQGPVCGNAQCERPQETSVTCEEDCGPPPPVCGNEKCEAPTETSYTCEEDCGPPPPVCGDRICHETESYDSCPADCEAPPAVCGNDMCEEDEDHLSCPADCEAPEPTSGMDTDSDGLSDVEETTIYGTSPNLSNTDGDSFVDLNEVLNLFDPATPAPSLLKDNVGVTPYMDTEFGYEIFKPTSWTMRRGEEDGAIFTASSGETITVLIDANEEGKDLKDWYMAFASNVSPAEIEVQSTKQGYAMILSPSRMTAFVKDTNATRVIIISYELHDQPEIQYRVTFQMMVNSFRDLE